jgi:hypothetical protein
MRKRVVPKIFKVLGVIILMLATRANAGVIIAQSDGSIPFTSSMYATGFGAVGDANFIDKSVIDALNSLGDAVIVKLTIGIWTDYYKPVSGVNLEGMLATSDDLHLWSSSATGVFIAPSYWTSSALPHLGGSAFGYAPEPERSYLNFWGSDSTNLSFQNGGCCEASLTDNPAWGQAFLLETVTDLPGGPNGVPAPATLALFSLGLLAMRRRITV